MGRRHLRRFHEAICALKENVRCNATMEITTDSTMESPTSQPEYTHIAGSRIASIPV